MAIIKLTEAYCVGELERDLKKTVSFFCEKSYFDTNERTNIDKNTPANK